MLIITLQNLGVDAAVPPEDQVCDYEAEVLITRSKHAVELIAKGVIHGHRRGDDWRALVKRVAEEL